VQEKSVNVKRQLMDAEALSAPWSAEFVVTDEIAHVNRAVKNVQHQIEVQVAGKLAAFDAAPQSLVRLLPAGPEKALAKRLQYVGLGLSGAEKSGDDASSPGVQQCQELVHLQAEVLVDGAGIGKVEPVFGGGGERVHRQCAFARPPPVDGGLANIGIGGDGFDG